MIRMKKEYQTKSHIYKRLKLFSLVIFVVMLLLNLPVSAQFNYDSWIAEEWVKTRDLKQPIFEQPPEVRPGDVVGWSADSGQVDVDDWAAAPVAQAVFARMGGVDASDGGMGFTIAARNWNGSLEKFTDLLGDCWWSDSVPITFSLTVTNGAFYQKSILLKR